MTRLSKRSESFENYVFFDIESKQTCSIVLKFISKRSEHVYTKEFKNQSEANMFILKNLKGQCHEIFASGFFLESVSPKPLIIPLGSFRIFSKIPGDIRSSRFATGVNDTGSKWKKSSIRKILIILVTFG